jgi:hypothetical protein
MANPIYNVSFSLVAEQLYPPVLRKTKHLQWMKVLSSPIQSLRDLIFDDYVDGSQYATYSSSVTYSINDRVVYINRGVYESLGTSIGATPSTATASWSLILDNYIGILERVKYNSQKMTYEYGLNRWFQCSGIYIENIPISYSGFLLGNRGPLSNTLVNVNNPSYMGNTFNVGASYDYIIWVPIAVFNLLGATIQERSDMIRSFADNYNLAGLSYDVQSY